jgi:patatin-like phospholipase/acyl hydrolase
MDNSSFRILSLDGGGILGLYSANILTQIEKLYLQGNCLSDYFQLITGTSTGGIIALALSLGRKSEEIVGFYQNYGMKIFPKRYGIGVFHHKYSNRILKKALTEFFGSATISDCKTAVCIPAIDITNCQPIIFKTNNNGNQTRDIDVKLTDISLATSAAPTYFPIYSFGNYSGLVDGGLWQNNPAICGVFEAHNYFMGQGKYNSVKILSIGNPLSQIPNTISVKSKNSSLIKWRDKLVHLPMKVSSLGTHQILSFLARNKCLSIESYLRIESNNLPDRYKKLGLDSATKKIFDLLFERSQFDFNHNKHSLKKFFEEEK